MNYFIGQIVLFPYNFVPKDFCACNGTRLSIAQHSTLYSLLGSKFGGDDRTYFNVPD